MNRPFRLLPALGFAAAVALTCLTATHAEEKSAPGSIRPSSKLHPTDLPALAKISFLDATKAALAAVPGSVIKAELEVEDGNLMYSFEIVTANKGITEVEIDAGNGKVLGTEIEYPKKEKKSGKNKEHDEKD